MKKLLTLALVGAMLTATGITAFAETTNVSYNVDPSYTVSIPAAIPLSDSAVEADIEASDVILEDGKQIKVELTLPTPPPARPSTRRTATPPSPTPSPATVRSR